jgi:hypothetical protein
MQRQQDTFFLINFFFKTMFQQHMRITYNTFHSLIQPTMLNYNNSSFEQKNTNKRGNILVKAKIWPYKIK